MPAGAQHVNPTAESVKEEQLLRTRSALPANAPFRIRRPARSNNPAAATGATWYQGPLRLIGGLAILGMIAVVIGFYFIRGPVRIEHGRSGRIMTRFSAFERFVHWMATVCFIILALSGLNLTFGKALLLPVIGPEAFTAISRWGKYAHNYLSFPFTLSVIVIFLMWIRWNLPSRLDIQWMMEGGGFGKKHPPADLFNAGQKSIYWVVVLGGALVAATGYVLMFPFWLTGIVGMQIAHLVHAMVALLYIAAMVFHVYMGTVGEEGAFEGMWDGTVDEEWAKQHHSVWHEREVAKGNIDVQPPPAEAKVQPAE